MQSGEGILRPSQRRWAWVGFVGLAVYAPIVAYALRVPFAAYTIPGDTWMLSVTVAVLVGLVIVVDDLNRAQKRRRP